MRISAILCAVALPVSVQAAPCVGTAFDQALPGATEVQRHYADVPSARFPGLWQQGRAGGFVYRLFSDLSGSLADSRTAPQWQIDVLCDAAAQSCTQEIQGNPDPQAPDVASSLGRCLLGQEVSASDFQRRTPDAPNGLPEDAGVPDTDRNLSSGAALATAAGADHNLTPDVTLTTPAPADANFDANRPAAIPEVAPNNATAPAPTATGERGPTILPDASCGLSSITAGTSAVQTLQRMLQAAGYDAGGDDGIMGGRTKQALDSALGPDSTDLDPEAAIRALNAKMCAD
ncbi:peptidoglycan-binding protein [Paracoccus sp. JM45]|uniref:peptidoglycan-binding domain-containing protein n=1 Tax=Paracoccus sp. JM45 TaxID=2283626 RepID=UPI000E6C20A8|nr:peptidoglycan-binding domain-containing protein [Paracoccus sp. JM45]RJE78726.1 peptidoglycan-binding protein [Paracoccus sp. JM45]